MQKILFLGIGGLSRSGKSTLASTIKNMMDIETEIIHQDDFVKEEKLIPTINDHIDWEHPDSIDWEKLDCEIELRKNKLRNLDVKPKILILEGLLALNNEKINEKFDKKIMLRISKNLFYERKSTDDRWGIEPKWYQDHIYESYLKYGIPNDLSDVKIIHGDEKPDLENLGLFLSVPIQKFQK